VKGRKIAKKFVLSPGSARIWRGFGAFACFSDVRECLLVVAKSIIQNPKTWKASKRTKRTQKVAPKTLCCEPPQLNSM